MFSNGIKGKKNRASVSPQQPYLASAEHLQQQMMGSDSYLIQLKITQYAYPKSEEDKL